MRKLSPVVGILSRIVSNARQDRSLRSTIALQFVGDDPERFFTLTSHQSAEEPLGCLLIATRLQQNVDDITVLVNGTPKILLLTVNPDEQFVQIPSVPETTLLFLETPSKVGSEFPAPSPDGFIGNNNPAFGEEIFDITEAQAETVIDPDGVADDFRWETVSVVTRLGAIHGSQSVSGSSS